MTQDEIIEMAKQASGGARVPDILIPVFERFAKLVASAEREKCAKIVELNADACMPDSLAQMYLYSNATAIRARGQA